MLIPNSWLFDFNVPEPLTAAVRQEKAKEIQLGD